jgi:lipopolysaccharide/colanic/teichoic acid biosynthesis glycosyltransferase
MKYIFDLIISFVLIIVATPFLLILSLLIKLDSTGPLFFMQRRVGRFGKKFNIIKFRTMYLNNEGTYLLTKGSGDRRITRIGKFIRKMHLDEFIQLVNVLKGDMSLVGPRPEIVKYTKYYKDSWKKVLQVKPGITGITVIKLADFEYKLLSKAKDPEKIYIKKILPLKLKADIEYVKNRSFFLDMKIIVFTILKIARRHS